MFRIVFDPEVSMFVVQLSFYGLYWRTCKEQGKPRRFNTYAEACKWVSDIGLCEAYSPLNTAKDIARLVHVR